MTISVESFKAYGYVRYDPTGKDSDYCQCLWHKIVREEVETKTVILYSIEVYQWRFPDQPVTYEADGCFYLADGTCFHVTRRVTDLKKVQEFMDNVYRRMYCIPDLINN